MSRSRFVLGVIAVLTAAIYAQVLGYGFVSFDDGVYITGNRHVRSGLSLDGLAWAFTSLGDSGNWHPLTWLSHMADVEFFGLKAGGHHLVNVILHAANAMVLFLVLRAATGAFWRSALAAVLFAVHPLHVESVAWVSERKDVLSTLCWVLALGAYLGYVRQPGIRRYCAVVLALALGLMSKAMVVTLPLVLLVLDWWPLGRPLRTRRERGRVLLEKLPLLLLAAAAGVVTIFAQRQALAMGALDLVHLSARLANALVASATYLWQSLWPRQLAFFYPLPAAGAPTGQVVAAGVLLAGAFLLVIARRRTRPWLAAGWLWYLITLLPVIGLVRVGDQSRADRYTYIPLIGIFLMVSWGLSGAKRPRRGLLVGAATAAVVGLLTAQAAVQAGYWRDDRTLVEHALQVTGEGNYIAYNTLGVSLVMEGKYDEAIRHYRQALRSRENFVDARLNLGVALTLTGSLDEALIHLEAVVRLRPRDAEVHYRLGEALLGKGRLAAAEGHYREAVRLDPGRADAYLRLGIATAMAGRVREALGFFEKSLQLAPDGEEGHYSIAVALTSLGREAEAIEHYRRALALNPGNQRAATNLRLLLARPN